MVVCSLRSMQGSRNVPGALNGMVLHCGALSTPFDSHSWLWPPATLQHTAEQELLLTRDRRVSNSELR